MADELRDFTDTALEAEYARGTEFYRAACETWRPVLYERLRRIVLGVAPDAEYVQFGHDAWDDGVYVTVESLLDANRTLLDVDILEELNDAGRAALNELLADLTAVEGIYLPAFQLRKEVVDV